MGVAVTGEEFSELVGRALVAIGDPVVFHLDDGWLMEGVVSGFIRPGAGGDVLGVTLIPPTPEEAEAGSAIHVPVSSIRAVQKLGKVQHD